MARLSWVRLTRRLTGLVRQPELTNLEKLIDREATRQPAYNYFILSCAIPAGIATIGGLSVFVAWIAGNTGLPLAWGAALTVLLSAGAWFTFFRLYQAVPPAQRHLRKLISKFSERYASFGNIILGEQILSDQFATLLDEVVGIYLPYSSPDRTPFTEAPSKALNAIEDAMSKLMEVALLKDHDAQDRALTWAQPMLEELRLLNQSLIEQQTVTPRSLGLEDPLAQLREARSELETGNAAIQELDHHLDAH
ncbi:MAG: hypothetical protein KF824_05380 [Fimbriimonadaceae bacterium]|nr:MAG: hypothetical protein KF824_05380 [Fimbriimonadaceae bacterium]